MGDAAPASLTIVEAAQLIRRRKVSAVELTEAHLQRIERLNPKLNAFITVTSEEALAQARQAKQDMERSRYRSPLHGIPVSLKDVYYTKGILTTAGSKIMANFVPAYDCTVWKRLRNAGAVLVGKCNMSEFALGGATNANPHFGPVRNPWDLERVCLVASPQRDYPSCSR